MTLETFRTTSDIARPGETAERTNISVHCGRGGWGGGGDTPTWRDAIGGKIRDSLTCTNARSRIVHVDGVAAEDARTTSTPPAGTRSVSASRVASHTNGITRARCSGGRRSARFLTRSTARCEKSQQYTIAVGSAARSGNVVLPAPQPTSRKTRPGAAGGGGGAVRDDVRRRRAELVLVRIRRLRHVGRRGRAGLVVVVVAAAAVVVVVAVDRGGSAREHVGELAAEVVPVLEEPVRVVLVEDVPVLPRVFLVLSHPELRGVGDVGTRGTGRDWGGEDDAREATVATSAKRAGTDDRAMMRSRRRRGGRARARGRRRRRRGVPPRLGPSRTRPRWTSSRSTSPPRAVLPRPQMCDECDGIIFS